MTENLWGGKMMENYFYRLVKKISWNITVKFSGIKLKSSLIFFIYLLTVYGSTVVHSFYYPETGNLFYYH